MICPHCEKDLRRTERPDLVCSSCKRPFAFEPKENALRLHDMRTRRLADRLGDNGRLRYTVRQLWYAAARGRIPTPTQDVVACAPIALVTLGLPTLILGVLAEFEGGVFRVILWISGTLLVVLLLLSLLLYVGSRRSGEVEPPLSLEDFRTMVLHRWPQVYGAPPPGLVDESRTLSLPEVPDPQVALLCPDHAVLVCLALNGLPGARRMALVSTVAAVPPGVPVLVLHDASPAGLELAAEALRAFGPRARILGLAPRSVRTRERAKAVRLCTKPLPKERLAALRATGAPLSEEEWAWLARGWWSPLAAVPPAKLLGVVDRAAEHLAGEADPDRRRARRVGFLSWPES